MLSQILTNSGRLSEPGSGKRVLLAVSGGVDSVVMAHMYMVSGIECAVAHCNFNLRGDASDSDALLVKQLAENYGFKYHEVTFQTKEFAKKWKVSTQMAARRLRYEWFSALAETHGYDQISVAHHADDQAETILLNLVRGAGIRGLRGMRRQNGIIYRPILILNRDEILEYALSNHLIWREDQSNSDVYYRRNRIRHEVIPVLKKINPSLIATFTRVAERIAGAEMLLEHSISEWKRDAVSDINGQIRIRLSAVVNAAAPVFQLHSLLEPYGFSYSQVKEVCSTLENGSGKIFHSATHRLLLDRETLILTEESAISGTETTFSVEVFKRPEDFVAIAGQREAYFDAAHLKLPLSIRSWQIGDTFKPFGMNGRKKKVSDLLIDRKVDLESKNSIRVVADRDGNIVWVVGIRGAHETRITPETVEIAKITVSERQSPEIDVTAS